MSGERGYESDLLAGLAQELQDAGVAVYRPDTPYEDGETAITFGTMLDQPDRCVTLTTYPLTDQPREALSLVGVQVRSRAESYLDANDLNVAIFRALHGLTGRQYGTCHLVQLLRRTSVPMGADTDQRWEHSANLYADINPPTTALRPE
ncbi:minor capsid protein [Intrasporangium flavum]|uniref:minor capsid protein n=1 Tax=Intrasporangium flavum TaxID=1428657 RepID=UPI00096ED8B7|nr:minor capsid protein [Intrasporangium flavum]